MESSKYNMSHIDAMNGYEFEYFIADLLRKLGYQNVDVTRGSGDQGVDVLAEKDDVRYAIQCKCYSSDLGNTPIQEVNTGKIIYHCHVGVVVTNRYFTQGAQEAAKATGVLLWDRSKLTSLIAQAGLEISAERLTQQKGETLTLWSGSPLLRRGGIALKDKDWKKARQFFDRVLNTDPENAEAYLGLAMAEEKLSDKHQFEQFYVRNNGHLESKNIAHTREFASPALKAWFSELEKRVYEERIIEQKALKRAQKTQAGKDEIRKKELENAKIRLAPIRESIKRAAPLISVASGYVAGVKPDDTVVISDWTRSHTNGWQNIIGVAIGGSKGELSAGKHIVGLKSDGTVVATGDNFGGQCNVSDWADIVAVAADYGCTVGLKSDGTVIETGSHGSRMYDWTDIVAIARGYSNTFGLKSDGTLVVSDSDSSYNIYRDIRNWQDIVAIAAGNWCTVVGLKSDGTVVVASKKEGLQQYFREWMNIVAVAAGGDNIVGLKSNGTAISITIDGYNNWNRQGYWGNDCGAEDIVAIACEHWHIAMLKSDGTVVDLDDWKLFNDLETLEQERKVALLESERTKLQTELANLKGLFTGRRRREIEARLAEIEMQFQSL